MDNNKDKKTYKSDLKVSQTFIFYHLAMQLIRLQFDFELILM